MILSQLVVLLRKMVLTRSHLLKALQTNSTVAFSRYFKDYSSQLSHLQTHSFWSQPVELVVVGRIRKTQKLDFDFAARIEQEASAWVDSRRMAATIIGTRQIPRLAEE